MRRVKPIDDVGHYERHDNREDTSPYIHAFLHKDQRSAHQNAVKHDVTEHDGNKAVTKENIAKEQTDHGQLNGTGTDGIDRIQSMAKRPNQRGDQASNERATEYFFNIGIPKKR